MHLKAEALIGKHGRVSVLGERTKENEKAAKARNASRSAARRIRTD